MCTNAPAGRARCGAGAESVSMTVPCRQAHVRRALNHAVHRTEARTRSRAVRGARRARVERRIAPKAAAHSARPLDTAFSPSPSPRPTGESTSVQKLRHPVPISCHPFLSRPSRAQGHERGWSVVAPRDRFPANPRRPVSGCATEHGSLSARASALPSARALRGAVAAVRGFFPCFALDHGLRVPAPPQLLPLPGIPLHHSRGHGLCAGPRRWQRQ